MAVESDSNNDLQSEDDGDKENALPPIDPDSDESDEAAEHADDDMSDAEEEEKTPAPKRPRPAPGVNEGNGRPSTSRKKKPSKDPARASARRAQRIVEKILYELSLRPDIRADVLNRVILKLTGEERRALRGLGAMQQEQYLAKRECVDFLEKECFNALHSVDLRACEALSFRLVGRIRERFACDDEGKRRIICRPPSYAGIGNPLTRKSNREQGIKWEQRAVMVPYCFRNSEEIAAAADRVLDGRTLHLAHDFDGAAWDLWESSRDLLMQLERDGNLLHLPAGALRVLQLIFDGHGWNSRVGACRFVLRCTHTMRDHNATRNARNPIFALGSDKHAHLMRMMEIGGDDSMMARLYGGLVVKERALEDMPAHIQAQPLFCALAMIECATHAMVIGALACVSRFLPVCIVFRATVDFSYSSVVGACGFEPLTHQLDVRCHPCSNRYSKTFYHSPFPKTLRCDIEIEIPVPPAGPANHGGAAFDGWARPQRARVTGSGDCAAAHAGGAMDSPVNRTGCCFRCLEPKKNWIDTEKCDLANKRGFVYQVHSNILHTHTHTYTYVNIWICIGAYTLDIDTLYKSPNPISIPHLDSTSRFRISIPHLDSTSRFHITCHITHATSPHFGRCAHCWTAANRRSFGLPH